MELFDSQVSPILETMHLNIEQSRTVAALRDTLLPKLLSGELRVTDLNNPDIPENSRNRQATA